MPHRLFLPKKNRRSKILSIKALLIVNVVLVSIVFLRLFSTNVKDFNILGFATDIRSTELFNETNLQRQKAGLGNLTYSKVLEQAAQKKANDMFSQNYWAHVAPNGKTPWDFILGENYKYTYAGENLAKDFQKSSSVVKAWMNSTTHRDNLLNSNYTQVGFAVVNGTLLGKETTVVVQMFGTPYGQVASLNNNKESAETPVTENSQVKIKDIAQVNVVEPNVVLDTNSTTNESTDSVLAPSNAVNITSELLTVDLQVVNYFGYFLLIIFAFSLVVDGVLAYKNKYLRLTGNTISHFILLILSILFIYYLKHPTIL